MVKYVRRTPAVMRTQPRVTVRLTPSLCSRWPHTAMKPPWHTTYTVGIQIVSEYRTCSYDVMSLFQINILVIAAPVPGRVS